MSKPIEKKESSQRSQVSQRKSLFLMALTVAVLSILLFWGLMNFSAIAVALGKVFGVFLPIVYGFFIAFILNIFLRPLENLWDKIFSKKKVHFKLKRAVCLTLSILLVVTILFTVIFLIMPTLTQTVYSLIDVLPDYLDFLGNKFNEIKLQLDEYNIQFPSMSRDSENLNSQISQALPQIGFSFLNTTIKITASVFSGIINFTVAFVFAIYMLAQKEKLCFNLKKLLYSIFPSKTSDKIVSVFNLINTTFTKFAAGQMTEALILGSLCFIGMLVLGFPYALIISILITVTALIPILGAWIGAVVGALLIFMINPMQALWFLIFLLILQQMEEHLIYPKVIGKSIGLPGILVLTAITVGGKMYGIWGMLFGVPIMSILYVLLNQFINRRLKEKKIKIK